MPTSLAPLIRQRSPFFWGYLLFVLVSAVLLIAFPKADLFLLSNRYHTLGADYFFATITYLGEGYTFVLVGLMLLFFNRWAGIAALASFALSSLVSQALKKLVFSDSPRPQLWFSQRGISIRVVDWLPIHHHNSFPSGHSITLFAMCCLLALVLPRRYGVWLALLAVVAGYSRVYLAQHFLGDVLAGSIIGIGSTLLCYWLLVSRRSQVAPNLPRL
jgi:membrane-associated phospholipid phosphatase